MILKISKFDYPVSQSQVPPSLSKKRSFDFIHNEIEVDSEDDSDFD